MIRSDTAYAKINLALHVRRRRRDGYHELETLFAFLDVGDVLTVEEGLAFTFRQSGPFANATGADEDNLVVRAARLASGEGLPPLSIAMTKNLPVAAGLGGGSADAAALLRLMGAGDRHDLAATLGADVPACLDSVPAIGKGTGTALTPVHNDVRGLSCLLVNPNIPLSTAPVFRGWDGVDRGPMPEGSAREIAMASRNDLEAPAVALCPQIALVLTALQATGPMVARMSGSGASCFAVYANGEEAAAAQQRVTAAHSGWWTMRGKLR